MDRIERDARTIRKALEAVGIDDFEGLVEEYVLDDPRFRAFQDPETGDITNPSAFDFLFRDRAVEYYTKLLDHVIHLQAFHIE